MSANRASDIGPSGGLRLRERLAPLFRTKSMDQSLAQGAREGQGELRKVISTPALTAMGIGAIIGTGIFVLTGVAAARYAGPGVVLSFVLAGLVAALAALVYAELAAMLPVAGSAYTFAYASLGELVAWIIGWDLVLEYAVAASAVAVGWSGYLVDSLASIGLHLPAALTTSPFKGGLLNLPALGIVLGLAAVLVLGTKESTRTNFWVVAVKVLVIGVFLAVGLSHLRPGLWKPFLPFGMTGVIHGASIIFFAYIGFDAVATAAEETKDPGRQLPTGILASLGISTILYLSVALVLTGLVSYRLLDVPSPLSFALLQHGYRWAGGIVGLGGLAGLTSVMLVDLFAQSRILYAMGRDGLLPGRLTQLHARFHTPVRVILLTAAVVGATGALFPVEWIAEMANIGTLAAFVLVSIGVIVLRYTQPNRQRPFRVPFFPVTPALTVVASLYLMSNLPRVTWIRFVVWLLIGLTLYLSWGRHHSSQATPPRPSPSPQR